VIARLEKLELENPKKEAHEETPEYSSSDPGLVGHRVYAN